MSSWGIKNLILDSVLQITNAADEFGLTDLRTKCCFHVAKSLKKIIGEKKSNQFKKILYDDLWKIQLLSSQEIFEKEKNPFLMKWTDLN
ncbi:hypothetical protein AYI68_g3773 [Smittium mucronatum]|uniref:Uncharacterized protein n=1 Tax=Smittium mucronatum TaxID=133383 RepID=A0A1R0GYX1_9FUNG|nr:hypothetical protein AYI68_g3773 [Smittium mucronatum]